MIAGFEDPTDGKIFIDHTDCDNVPANLRDVNTVFQNYALFPHLSIRDNIAFGLKLKKLPKAEIDKKVDKMVELIKLEEHINKKPSQLSGGQKQRVAIARALVNRPEVLLLDEPLGALDLQLRRAMQIELKKLQKKLGITFVYITHDQEEAINMSDTIAVMNQGRFEQTGTPDEIYNHPHTSYVATFVGNANILKGKVEEIKGSGLVVSTSGGKAAVDTEGVRAKLAEGSRITFAVRSENIQVETDPKQGIPATVTEKSFAGGQLRMVLKTTEGQEIIASRYGIDASVKVGEKVFFHFKSSDAVLVDCDIKTEREENHA